MTARPCLGCSCPVRCKGQFVFCDGCWRLARAAFNREHDGLDLISRSRASNACMTDLAWLTTAICGERTIAATVA